MAIVMVTAVMVMVVLATVTLIMDTMAITPITGVDTFGRTGSIVKERARNNLSILSPHPNPFDKRSTELTPKSQGRPLTEGE